MKALALLLVVLVAAPLGAALGPASPSPAEQWAAERGFEPAAFPPGFLEALGRVLEQGHLGPVAAVDEGPPDDFVGGFSYVGYSNGPCGTATYTSTPVRHPVNLFSFGGPPAGPLVLGTRVEEDQGSLAWLPPYPVGYYFVLTGTMKSPAMFANELGYPPVPVWRLCVGAPNPGSITLVLGWGQASAG